MLPRVSNAISGIIELSETDMSLDPEVLVLMGVIDFSDAFWMIPLRKSEQRYFVTRICGRYFVFLCTAQGSIGAPLTRSRFGALLARVMRGVIDTRASTLIQYVDDTLLAFLGTHTHCRTCFATVAYIWVALGLPLALKKAAFGTTVIWTSAALKVTTGKTIKTRRILVEVKVKPDTDQEVRSLTGELLGANVMAVKKLRTYVGKCTAIASVMHTWSPFLRQVWTALPTAASGTSESHGTRAPINCAWTKQFHESLVWIMAFLADERSQFVRVFDSEAYHGFTLEHGRHPQRRRKAHALRRLGTYSR